MTDSDEWYYCLKHQAPERGIQCAAQYRLGPYPDEATARRALEIAKEREDIAEESDRAWHGEE